MRLALPVAQVLGRFLDRLARRSWRARELLVAAGLEEPRR